jgi:plastocyanin
VTRLLTSVLLVGFLAGSTGGAAAAKPTTVKIAIEGMHFSPAAAQAKEGDTVIWTNADVVAHTVTALNGTFDSKMIAPGGTWTFVVRKKGTFDYKCAYHQPMTATLTVR